MEIQSAIYPNPVDNAFNGTSFARFYLYMDLDVYNIQTHNIGDTAQIQLTSGQDS
jgi:hypothetical protein